MKAKRQTAPKKLRGVSKYLMNTEKKSRSDEDFGLTSAATPKFPFFLLRCPWGCQLKW